MKARVSVLLALALFATAARADEEEGRRAFAEGSERMRQGQWAEALPLLVESNRQLPSPNTTLLVGRCLRALGRDEEAVEQFEAAAADGDARARAGEERYRNAADAARTEGAELRASLGVLRVRLVGARAHAHVDVDGREHAVRADGTAVVLHRPGVVRFVVVGEGDRRALEATLAAGRWTDVDVELGTRNPPPAPATTTEKRDGVTLPLGIGLGALGVVGLGSFTIFGLRSQSTYDDLSATCAPRCQGTDRDAATRADREQTIANVSLVVGAVALVAGGVLVVQSLRR